MARSAIRQCRIEPFDVGAKGFGVPTIYSNKSHMMRLNRTNFDLNLKELPNRIQRTLRRKKGEGDEKSPPPPYFISRLINNHKRNPRLKWKQKEYSICALRPYIPTNLFASLFAYTHNKQSQVFFNNFIFICILFVHSVERNYFSF